MRAVVWNCAQNLSDKHELLTSLRPDIAIIPECAEPDILRKKSPDFAFSDCEWQGDDKNKGLGVFAFGGRSLRRHQSWERSLHIFLPVEVRGVETVNLLAVWAFNHRAPKSVTPNPKTTALALEHYTPFLRATSSIVAGDFNASVIWDKPGKAQGFGEANRQLNKLGLVSAYHESCPEAFGKESRGTLWFRKRVEPVYHIDYVYVPRAAVAKGLQVSVGESSEWMKSSDHAPVTVELSLSE